MLENILRKKGWRSDIFWTMPFAYKSPLKLIPLFADTWALMRSQYWAREKIQRLQDARMRELFHDALRIPFWRRVFESARVADSMSVTEILAKLPVVSKKNLIDRHLEDIADTRLLKRSDADHTSGSTGKPFHFYQDWHSSLRSFAVTERTFRAAASKRFPIVYMRARPRHGFTFYRHVWFFLRGYNSIVHRMEEFAALGKSLKRGFVLYGYTSWVVELARQMERLGMRLPIRAAMVAGEHVSETDREYIEKVLGTELYTLYASRELGFLGFECERHNMHVNEEWALIEIVGPDGNILPYGKEGRLIVTTFDNRVMPYIRYEIGDIGSLSDEPCPCGRTLRTLTFRGRTSELIDLSDGRTVALLDIAYSLGMYRDSIRQYQIVQKGPLAFVFRIVRGPMFGEHEERIGSLMTRLLHPDVRIEWEFVESIGEANSGKAVYFIRDFS